MNIALLHYSAPPIVGGVESILSQHAKLMADAGHNVRIIAARGQQTDPRIPFVAVPLVDSRHERIDQMKHALDRGDVPSDFDALKQDVLHALESALDKVDVVIAHNVCSLNKNLALTAALHEVNARGKIRTILWHHDLAWTTPRYRSELHNGYPWDLLCTAWPGAKQVVISDARRDELADLMQISHDAISLVPNGIDVAQFLKLEPQTQTLLDATGALNSDLLLLLPVRLTPRKNIELALRVLAELRNSFADPMLIVTGPLGAHNAANASYFAKLKSLRSELALSGAAHFLAELSDAFIPDAVVADLYRAADALFLPSREEGFGLPLLEAGLTRMPVFATDIPALRALADGDVQLFSPDEDPAKLARMIATYVRQNPQYRFATRVRMQFAWPRVYRQHIAPLLVA